MTTISRIAGHAPVSELVRSYLAADYRWQHEGDWHDLHIGLQTPALELLYPDVDAFGFLSAWNPYSVEQTEMVNRDADRVLHDALIASGRPFCAAFASATNRSWREPSWVVMGFPVAEFDALSRQHGQLGTLCWTRGHPVRLRVDATRPDDFGDDEHIDWLK